MLRTFPSSVILAALTSACGLAIGCGSEFTATDVGPGGDASIDSAQGGASGQGGTHAGGAAGNIGGSAGQAAGAAGAGGQAGAGGAAGQGGDAGSSGSAGTGGTAGAAGSAGTAGAGGACAPSLTCLEPPPGGWAPFNWLGTLTSDMAASCPSSWAGSTFYDPATEPLPAPAVCTCSCNPQGVCKSSVSCAMNSMCSTLLQHLGDAEPTCTEALASKAGNYCFASPPQAVVTCELSKTPDIPPVNWVKNAKSCSEIIGGPECGTAGICTPSIPDGHGLCIAGPGELGCPAGFGLSVRLMMYTHVQDSRGCDFSGCGCGPGATVPCGCVGAGCSVEVYTSGCTSGPAMKMPTNGTCTQMAATTSTDYGIRLIDSVFPSNVGCLQSGPGKPTGTIEASGVITFCCQS